MGQLSFMTLKNYLEAAVDKHPDKAYIIYEGYKITYADMERNSDILAVSLLNMGLQKGDKIAIVAPNMPEWLYVFFAAAKIGASVVALNVRYRMAEFDYMINNSECKFIISITEFGGFNFEEFFLENKSVFPTVEKYIFIGEDSGKEVNFGNLLEEKNQYELLEQYKQNVTEEDVPIIIYTSGTTGKPKGAMITNKNILASARAEVEHFKIKEDDIFIGCLPLNHVGGITCVCVSSLVAGCSVILLPSFSPDTVLESIEKYNVTIMAGVPTMYVMILNSESSEKYVMSSVRYCIIGGSNVEPQVCNNILNMFPNAAVLNLYGLSETAGACVLSRLDDPPEKVVESIGVPIDDFLVKVCDKEGNELPPGEIG